MKFCGIDPGLTGAVALIDRGRAAIYPMPVDEEGKEIRADELHSLLYRLRPELVVVEKLHGMPGFGSSNFKYGGSYYAAIYCCQILHLAIQRVSPQIWKREILQGTKKDKSAAIKWAGDAYPNTSLIPPGATAPSHDFAEALALAEFGLRMKGGA